MTKIANVVLWVLIGLLITTMILLRVPAVQQFMGSKTADALSEKLGTEVSVGRVDLGFLNRITIDDVNIRDQQGEPLLKASRLSAKIDYLALAKGKIVVTSAQLFGVNANLYQEKADAPDNFQFLIDSLASKDTTSHTPLDLRINSLIIRHGAVSYHKRHVAPKSGMFSPAHIEASNISAHLILNALQDDSLNVNLKKMAFTMSPGLKVKDLTFKAVANRQGSQLSDFALTTAQSNLKISEVNASYRYENDQLDPNSLEFNGKIERSVVTPSELVSFVAQAKEFDTPFYISSAFSGTGSSLRISQLDVQSSERDFRLSGNGFLAKKSESGDTKWSVDLKQLTANGNALKKIANIVGKEGVLPENITLPGDISVTGKADGTAQNLLASGHLKTDMGEANLSFAKNGKNFSGRIETDGLNLQRILNNDDFGQIATKIHVDGQFATAKSPLLLNAKGSVSRFDFRNYSYQGIDLDGAVRNDHFDGSIAIDDPNVKLRAQGKIGTSGKTQAFNASAQVQHLRPSALHISDQWGDASFKFNVDADIAGQRLNTANGYVHIEDFEMNSSERQFTFDHLNLTATNRDGINQLNLESDFADIDIEGNYDYNTIAQSITNLIGSKLPTLPGLPPLSRSSRNNFTINAEISRSEWLNELFSIPITLKQPMQLSGTMNDQEHKLDLVATLPHFTYEGNEFRDVSLTVSTPDDTLRTHATARRMDNDGSVLLLTVDANAAGNRLTTAIGFEDSEPLPIKGILNADAQFFKTDQGKDAAQIDVHTSNFTIDNTIWTIEPGTIVYSKNDLTLDHVAISNNDQHLIVNGRANALSGDSLIAELQNIDVEYILDLVDFDAVEFSGQATGKAFVTKLFEKPEAEANLTVSNFRFENGRLGTLSAHARLNNEAQRIDINAVANDTLPFSISHPAPQKNFASYTTVRGFVSPQRDELELFINPSNARGEFLESFCGSFMRDIDLQVTGALRLFGKLDDLNLMGEAVADGNLTISSLNTTYTLHNDTVRLVPDRILLQRDTIFDAYGHIGIVNGVLRHQSLTRLTYDIGIEAQNLLAYDFRDFGNDTFCGTVYATGDCTITGRSGEVVIDVNVTPDENSEIRYNASSPDAINSGEFITWYDRDQALPLAENQKIDHRQLLANSLTKTDPGTDIHLNFLINANPRATLKVIMDANTGDYIALNGNGVIRATYFNKGSFDMFGNYNVDHGTYKLTIQNVIKKDFQIRQGGTVVFGGNPYHATLNLQALYTVAGVPLSDLQLGQSFTSNNIRVNCLMNITGTPDQPRVDFDLDMPTIGTDAKQMIFSLINSEEEMNQQVLYLLAVGRFYNQGTNNASADGAAQQSQTSLAMQSLFSGTLSQQINNVLSSLVKNRNWNFGANISTGDQGFYNAEYEGLLSGRLLNNRLLINGEFGYRDNPNATTSFIGDFDLQYLLRPSGNLAIKVYNQTNDRYFTRNSLNTQGVGLIMRKEFYNLKDFFGVKRKKNKPKTEEQTLPTDTTAVATEEQQEAETIKNH
ncbi:MAG: translocation/assembly module TamB [Prevotella sp.]|nr:translocation/assembly module TamB [Prevotella sp.]